MKTPEELAVEYADRNSGGECSNDWNGLVDGFLAGYQAAKNIYGSKLQQMRLERPAFKKNEIEVLIGQANSDGYARGFKDGLVAQESWISVKDRLPEDSDDLSIMLVWRSIEHDYDTVRWRYQQGWDCVIQDKATITHWMPLPKPPEE
jgi:hypothetical protein